MLRVLSLLIAFICVNISSPQCPSWSPADVCSALSVHSQLICIFSEYTVFIK